MSHHAKAPDGLCAKSLNLSDGGANVKPMRPGWFIRDGTLERVEQNMQHADGTQKGLRIILRERGKHLSDLGYELVKICHPCKLRLTDEQRRESGLCLERCCAVKVLSQEPDFLEQREWLTEVVERNGQFKILFYPKMHCELNFIEMLWGWLKCHHRKNCSYNFEDLIKGTVA
jgi:hypothetical protein